MISIIIPTLNEEKYLPRLLDSIKAQDFKEYELIISDAGSIDSTLEIAKRYGAKVVEGGIPSIGRNQGAKVSNNSLLIFIDADVVLPNNFLSNSIEEFNKKSLDLAVPYFNTDNDKLVFRMFFRNANFYKKVMQYTRFPDGTGQFVIIKRDVFNELKGFKSYHVAEDTDLFWRAARKKYKIGTISTKINSSTRRLEKIGVFWTLFVWGLIGIAMFMGLIHKDKVQNFFLKLYGGWRKVV